MLNQRENRKSRRAAGRAGQLVHKAALETLEQRLLLSVAVVQEGDSLFIKGDGADDAVDVMDLGGGNVVVTSPDPDPTGVGRPMYFKGVASIFVDTAGGNDSVSHAARSSAESPDGTALFDKFAAVSVNTGEGSDRFFLKFDGIKGEAAVKVELGAGDDSADLHVIGSLSLNYTKIEFSAGKGNDSLKGSFFDVFTEASIDLGAGDDTAELRAGYLKIGDIKGETADSQAGIKLDLSAGEGHDGILIGLLLPAVQKVREAAVRVDLGSGNDTLKFDASTAQAEEASFNFTKIEWRAGAGNDTVEGSFFDVFAEIAGDMGAGDDVAHIKWHGSDKAVGDPTASEPGIKMDLSAGDGHDAILIGLLLPAVQKVREAAVRVDLGAGDDTLQIDAASAPGLPGFLKIKIEAREGSDSVKGSFFDVFTELSADLGAGNDSFFLKLDGIKASDASAGKGSDRLDLSAGDGDDSVALLLPAVQKIREAAARIRLGSGNDAFQIDAAGPDAGDGYLKVELDAGAGNDTVRASFFDIFTELSADLGAGNDSAHIKWHGSDKAVGDPTASEPGIKMDLSAGDGHDAILIGLLLPAVQKVREAAAHIDLGAGNDTIKFDAASTAASLNFAKIKLNAGSGRDSVDMAFRDVFVDVAADLGTGDDSASFRAGYIKIGDIKTTDARMPDVNLDISAGDGNDDVTVGLLLPAVQKIREAAARISLGSGNDKLKIKASNGDEPGTLKGLLKMKVDAGSGNDSVSGSFFDVFTELSADLGSGNDSAAIDVFLKIPDIKGEFERDEAGFKIEIGAASGNDTVQINAQGSGDAAAKGARYHHIKVELDAGSGNDTVHGTFTDVFLDASLNLGSGNDSASLRAGYLKLGDIKGEVADREGAGFNLDISAGDGNDAILIGLLLPAVQKVREAAARIDLGDGNDTMAADIITGAGPGGGPHVKVFAGGGAGNDTIETSFAGVSIELDLDGGSGNDRISADGKLKVLPAPNNVSSRLHLSGGDGDDVLTLKLAGDWTDPRTGESLMDALVDGSDGRDTAYVSAGVKIVNVEKVFDLSPPKLKKVFRR